MPPPHNNPSHTCPLPPPLLSPSLPNHLPLSPPPPKHTQRLVYLAVWRCGVVHLVDPNDELLHTQSVGQHGVFSCLALLGDTSFKLSGTGSHNQHSTVSLSDRQHISYAFSDTCGTKATASTTAILSATPLGGRPQPTQQPYFQQHLWGEGHSQHNSHTFSNTSGGKAIASTTAILSATPLGGRPQPTQEPYFQQHLCWGGRPQPTRQPCLQRHLGEGEGGPQPARQPCLQRHLLRGRGGKRGGGPQPTRQPCLQRHLGEGEGGPQPARQPCLQRHPWGEKATARLVRLPLSFKCRK